MRRLLPIIFAVGIIPLMSQSQVIYNLNNQDLNFGGTGVTITAHVGSGTAVGDVVLYENVVTIGSQQIDAIVRTVALTGTMTDHDNPSTSGPGMSNNQARFFSPQFSFSSGGGSCEFEFEFIETDQSQSAELSPTKKVPFLQDGDIVLSDSSSILKYIRENLIRDEAHRVCRVDKRHRHRYFQSLAEEQGFRSFEWK